MDGFFGSAPVASTLDRVNDPEGVDLFAQAIAGRFNNPDKPLLTARLTPSNLTSNSPMKTSHSAFRSGSQVPTPLAPSSTSKTPMSLKFPAPHRPPPQTAASSFSPGAGGKSNVVTAEFKTVTPTILQEIIKTPNALIIDVRPHSAYVSSRLPHAVSLSVPSTLLKRPAFSLQKLSLMVSSTSARSRIQNWSKSSRVLVYDADTSALQEGSIVLGLMRKFRKEDFSGDIAWLQGGIQAIWRDHRHMLDSDPVSEDEGETGGSSHLRTQQLPQSAFQQSSTNMVNPSPSATKRTNPLSLAANDARDVARHDDQRRVTAANPFYDNIRQNLELSHGITERIPLRLSPHTSSRVKEIPFAWLRSIARNAGQDECAEALAMQFYRVELGEQRRLQGIMAHHSNQSEFHSSSSKTATESNMNEEPTDVVFPYSIIAGVEKGEKNSVVWDQNVHVIVMLTKQHEGGSLKCGRYWDDGQYGPLRLRLVEREGSEEEEDPGGAGGGGFFTEKKSDRRSPSVDDGHNYTIRRTFELINMSRSNEKPRTVTQLQYLGWPDMDVPASPKSLLKLMAEVDSLVEAAQRTRFEETGRSSPTIMPIVMHCSAGVGRTGAFIIVDAILDAMKNEFRTRLAKEKARQVVASEDQVLAELEQIAYSRPSNYFQRVSSHNAMDVDLVSVTPSVCSGPPGSSAPVSDNDAPDSVGSTRVHPQATPISPFRTLGHVGTRDGQEVSNSDRGHVVTLGVGNRLDNIHIPLVPSHASPTPLQTPRPSTYRSLQPSDSASAGPAVRSPVHQSSQPLQYDLKSTHTLPHAGSPRVSSNSGSLPLQAVGLHYDHPNMKGFTNDDADSMFEEETNPDFAMDIESLRPQRDYMRSQFHALMEGNWFKSEGGSSGSGIEANSAMARMRKDSESGSGDGSGSDGHNLRPLRRAFANMSSADDECGTMPQFDSTHMHRLPGGEIASDGSGSGEGGWNGGSASDFSGKTSSGSAQSGSSIGLGAFATLNMTSPVPSPGMAEKAKGAARATAPLKQGGESLLAQPLQRQAEARHGMSMAKPSLLQPKPLRLQPWKMPELVEGVQASSYEPAAEKRVRQTAQLPFRHRQSKRSVGSSIPSSSASSILQPSGGESYETPPSAESPLASRSPSACPAPHTHLGDEKKGANPHPLSKEALLGERQNERTGFDYTVPRVMQRSSKGLPPLLSSMNEPIRQVLEDMREQRMSLCQSLRQYVFVHTAIVEGAIAVLDQERELYESEQDMAGMLHCVYDDSPPPEAYGFEPRRATIPGASGGSGSVSGSAEDGLMGVKRRSSPTELPRSDVKGDPKLVKRPSVKKKSTSSGSNSRRDEGRILPTYR